MAAMSSRRRMSSIPTKLPRSSNVYKRGSLGGPGSSLPPPHHRHSLNRQSNVYVKGGQGQDPRNINDKMYQKEAMATLIEYLTTHGFNSPISSKLPSGKEIREIIEFLFRQVDPTIVLGKLEDEVPAFFKNLNYPFQISKSALYAAGSPHSWPGLLAALSWLVNMLIYEEKAEEIKESGAGLGYERNEDDLFFDYICTAYKEYMRGNDETCEQLDTEFRLQFEEKMAQLVQQGDLLEKEVASLKTKLHTLTTEPSPLAVLEGKKADFLTDITKFTSMIGNFQSHKEAYLKKMEEKKEDLNALKLEISKIAEENEALRQQIGSQQISVAGVEKMDKESQILDTRLHAITKTAQELQKEAWDEEVQSANMLRELEDVVVSYNTGIARLKHLYPEIEAQKHGINDIKINSREEKPEDILGFDVKGIFRPLVTSLMETIEKAIRDAREEVLVMQKRLYADEVYCQERADEVSSQIAQNKKLEAQFKARKQKLDNYIASKAAERNQIETSLAEKGETLRQMNAEADELLKKLEAEYELKLKAYKEEMEREQAEILEELQLYAEHKEYIRQALSRLEDRASQLLRSRSTNRE